MRRLVCAYYAEEAYPIRNVFGWNERWVGISNSNKMTYHTRLSLFAWQRFVAGHAADPQVLRKRIAPDLTVISDPAQHRHGLLPAISMANDFASESVTFDRAYSGASIFVALLHVVNWPRAVAAPPNDGRARTAADV